MSATVSIVNIPQRALDESHIRYGEGTVSDVEEFSPTNFARKFRYSEERVGLNLLLAICEALNTKPANIAITERNGISSFDYSLTSVKGETVKVEIKYIIPPDEEITQLVQEMSAGLAEWYYELTSAEGKGVQASFILPDIRIDQAQEIFEQLKSLLVSPFPVKAQRGEIIDVPDEYEALANLGVRVLIRDGSPPFVQITRGARTVGAPTFELHQLFQRAAIAIRHARKQTPAAQSWLIIWYHALYSAFSVSSAEREIRQLFSERPISPFHKVIITDGRSGVVIAND